jgi:hypothetical protein
MNDVVDLVHPGLDARDGADADGDVAGSPTSLPRAARRGRAGTISFGSRLE